jgi:hypothetical protein
MTALSLLTSISWSNFSGSLTALVCCNLTLSMAAFCKAKDSRAKARPTAIRLLLVSSAGCCDDDVDVMGRDCDDDDVIFSLHSRQFLTAQVQTNLKH